jgi:ABC-2 type transport system permease protein
LEHDLQFGAGHWLRSYGRMLRFDLVAARSWLFFSAALQVLIGAGMGIIYGIYLPQVSPRTAQFIVTGVPTLALIPIGFVLLPSIIGQQKTAGVYDFILSLPVPRSASVASTLTVFSLAAVPAAAVAVILAAWHYHVHLSPSPALFGAIVLVTVMASSVGYAVVHAIANPVITNVITNTLLLVALLFSPIVFPPDHYPAWLVRIHEFLPIYPMAVVVRAALLPGLVVHLAFAYAVVGAWTVLGWASAAWIIGRRH